MQAHTHTQQRSHMYSIHTHTVGNWRKESEAAVKTLLLGI